MSVTLTGAVQTCAVNTGYATKLWSDRYENPDNTLCPVWNGLDQYGRVVSFDSYNTKYAGCSSALDRVEVENVQRPRYFDFVALDASGYLNPSALGAPVSTKEGFQKATALERQQRVYQAHMRGGNVGIQYANTAAPYSTGVCGVNGQKCASALSGYNYAGTRENYVDTRANRNFQERRDLSGIANWKSGCYACSAGNR